jgi:tetratricopeptide (TPR) repeat protein
MRIDIKLSVGCYVVGLLAFSPGAMAAPRAIQQAEDFCKQGEEAMSAYCMTTNRVEARKFLTNALFLYQQALEQNTNSITAKLGLIKARTNIELEKHNLPTNVMALNNALEQISLLSQGKDLLPADRRKVVLLIHMYERAKNSYEEMIAREENLRVRIEANHHEIQRKSEERRKQRQKLSPQLGADIERLEAECKVKNDEQTLLKLAEKLLRAGADSYSTNYEVRALAIIGGVLQTNANSAAAMALMARYYVQHRNRDLMFKYLTKAVEINPDDPTTSYVVLDATGARAAFIQAYKRTPSEKLMKDILALNPIVPLAERIATNNHRFTKGLLMGPEAFEVFPPEKYPALKSAGSESRREK